MRRRITALAAAVLLLAGLTGCSTYSENPDEIGLYYLQGNLDGNKFDTCIDPGATGDAEWNNKVVWLPTNLRTWNVTPVAGPGTDSTTPTVVSTKPEKDQPSGVQVSVWTNTKFYLNTFCDSSGGVVKPWWENLGRRYNADTPEGWNAMLSATLVPALNKATQDVVRSYESNALVGNIDGVRAKAQGEISALFTTELKRLTGGDYFCGPTFNRATPTCPPIEMIVVDVDFTDAGIQEARNAKQKAVENGAALVAEAEARVNAASKLNALYQNEAWMALEMAKLHLEEVKACSANPTCTIFFTSDGKPQINAFVNPRK